MSTDTRARIETIKHNNRTGAGKVLPSDVDLLFEEIDWLRQGTELYRKALEAARADRVRATDDYISAKDEIERLRAQLEPSGDDMEVARQKSLAVFERKGKSLQLARLAIEDSVAAAANAIDAALAAEREACAKIVDSIVEDIRAGAAQILSEGFAKDAASLNEDADNVEKIAKAIRARGEKP